MRDFWLIFEIVRATANHLTLLLAIITMDRSIEVQAQIRRDAKDHCRALRELKEWEEEMKRRKEEEQEQLQGQKDTTTNCSGAEDDTAKVAEQIDNQPPGLTTQPVRTGNVDDDGHNGGVGGVRTNANSTAMTASTMATPTSISNQESSANPSSEVMTANAERQRGNDCYAAGKYDDAIKCYTACLRFDPSSAVVYSNRGMYRLTYIQFLLLCNPHHILHQIFCALHAAMAHLKKKDWLKAEDDATMALSIDASHVKSYQRRSVARASLGKLRAALLDLSRAQVELESLGATTGGDISGMQKSIAAERKRVESLLRAAMKRAPKRCNVPIVVVREDKEEDKEEILEEPSDDAVSKAGSVDNGSTSDVSKGSDEWVVVDTSVSGRNNESPTPPSNTSSPAKLVPRQHKKPTTWYEFETTWRSLDSLEERSAYLSSIRPKRLANLYRNGMEDIEIVVDVVVAAGRLMTMDANQASLAKEYIQCVANIKSIDIPVMMMNDGQRKKVQDVIDKVFGGDNGKAAVAFKFGCSL